MLVGNKGWDYDDIFESIEGAKQVKNRIILTGFADDEDLAPIYSNALAFCYMSYYEGFGLPPLEAMQCGTPVITSNTSSLPEVVDDAGIMLHPTDDDGLTQAMLNFYKDENLRDRYVQKSLARARQFSWKKCAQQTINAYHIAMDTKRE